MRKKLGDDTFNGLVTLVECKHEIAQGYARTAADFGLAGLWLQVLSYAGSRQKDQARALLPDLMENDRKLSSESQAEAALQAALQKLTDIRQEYQLPRGCG